MTVGEVRVPRARLIVVVGASVAALSILWLSRTYTFYFDEWDLILSAPDWTWSSYLQPHNEHPVILTRLAYAGLLATAGLRTYLPYMASLLALHAAGAVLLFEIVRRRAGDVVALGCAALLLVLGAGWENLLWAFQIAFVGAVACGLGALLALEGPRTRTRLAVAVLLLTAAVMFSGIGLFFATAAAVRLVVDRDRRRDLGWFVPLGVAVGAWYLLFGRTGGAGAAGVQLANLAALPAYVGWGIATSAGGLIGFEGSATLVVFTVALAAVGLAWWRRRPDPLALGAAAGLISFYALTGLTRAQFGYSQAGAGRYVYVGAVFWLILLADAAKYLPWRGTWRPALVACAFLGCFAGSVVLFTYAEAKTVQMMRATADEQALAAERNDPCLDPSGAVDVAVMPWVKAPGLYYRAIDRFGDPGAGQRVVDHADYDAAIRNLRQAACSP